MRSKIVYLRRYIKRWKIHNIKIFDGKRLFKNRRKIGIASGIITSCFLFYLVFYTIIVQKNHKEIEYDNAYYYASLFQNDAGLLQNSFEVDVKNSVNDKNTKASAYFITRRYIDNGGKIYEIYDYVESRPALSFLKEAENIYPQSFERIKNRRLPFSYSDDGMYAYLAYVEVLEKYGYADIAMLGTAANQYIMMAYYKKTIMQDKLEGKSLDYPDYRESDIENDINKAIFFATKSKDDITKILDYEITSKDVPMIDILLGISQYASTLRYFNALGVNFSSPKTSREVFSFATGYAYHLVPEMYLATSLLNASTLLLVGSSTASEIRNAIYPFLDIHPAVDKSNGIVDKIIQSRSMQAKSKYRDLDTYSRKNILALGKISSEFKAWLLSNGWREDDFK